MTDTYELDALNGAHSSEDSGDPEPSNAGGADGGGDGTAGGDGATDDGGSGLEEALGVPVPDEHVGAFVAETFEDAERDTTWEQVVDAMVAPEARDAWAALTPREQAVEVLGMADEYDRRAVEHLESVPLEVSADPEPDLAEARRLRRNADVFRDGVAAAYAEGHVDDEGLVAAVEESAFDTARVARREELMEQVAKVHDVEFRPYGGTLMGESDRETATPASGETW